MKEELKSEATRIAGKYKVSYGWSGGKELLALVIGASRLLADYPLLPAYVQPVQPATTPTGLPAQPTPAQLCTANDAINVLNRDWAAVSGFIRAMGENIRNAMSAEFYEDLQHHVYGYDNVWPIGPFHKIDQHVPLDKPARKQCRNNYLRGWQLSSSKPEKIQKLKKAPQRRASSSPTQRHHDLQRRQRATLPPPDLPQREISHANNTRMETGSRPGLRRCHHLRRGRR